MDTVRKRKALIRRDGDRCRICGSHYDLTVDHVKPRAHGGSNKMSNLQLLCEGCNQRKATKRTNRVRPGIMVFA